MSFTAPQVNFLQANAEFVECRRLFKITLLGEVFRLAESPYPIIADGATWTPGLHIVSASAIDRSEAFAAIPAEYVIAALPLKPTDTAIEAFDRMATEILHDVPSWFGGGFHQYLQLLVDGTAVGPPISLHNGWIRDVKPVEDVETAQFRVTVESIFARRNRTPLGEYTDRDQQRRSPGDRGAEFVPGLAEKTITGWPY